MVCLGCALFAAMAIGSSAQTVNTIHSFNGSDGSYPEYVVLTQGGDGLLYGTASSGGNFGFGTIFKQRTAGTGFVTLYNFTGTDDGAYPIAGLTLAWNGSFYGTTIEGGAYNSGEIFKMTPGGILTVLYSFTGGADGIGPPAPPIEAIDGNFYGTTIGETFVVFPTIYKLTPAGVLSTVYTFPDTYDFPFAPLLQTADGYLYATSGNGGSSNCGQIIKLTMSGVVKAIHSFDCNAGGVTPVGAPIQARDGNLYGTTLHGGTYDAGIIYKLDGKTGSFSVLYNFGSIPNDGYGPQASLTEGSDGNLYGGTAIGGTANAGTLFQVTSSGVYAQLYSFPSVLSGQAQEPYASPTQATGGAFYGATYIGGSLGLGSIYKLNMGLGPFITFVRSQGMIGSKAQILGQGLTGTTSVTFNGVAATKFSVVSDTYMTAVVPAGATTGAVVVATPAGNLTSNVSFRISK
jgi:uncharacterized repeat protein (TIGR03803 family)